jgi:hypothetical protein
MRWELGVVRVRAVYPTPYPARLERGKMVIKSPFHLMEREARGEASQEASRYSKLTTHDSVARIGFFYGSS